MIKKLQIQNFKIWEDTGEIRMAPITVFFGTNSSGKSSIGQFLMMLKQTAVSQDRNAVFDPGNKETPVQLSSYQDMVFRHETSRSVKFNYEWNLPEPLLIEDPIHKEKRKVDSIRFCARTSLKGDRVSVPVVDLISYILFTEGTNEMSIEMTPLPNKNKQYQVKAENYELVRKTGRAWPVAPPLKFYAFPDEASAYYQNADFVKELNLVHEKLFHSIAYLGPLRTKTERIYSWTGVVPDSVGVDGGQAIAALLGASDRMINLSYKAKMHKIDEIVAKKLQVMGLVESFKLEPLSEKDKKNYVVKVKTKGTGSWVDLPDVGVGVSQVLPVLVQCFLAPENSIVIMEQPEIHLHPSAQALLADVMIDVIRSRENGRSRNVQLIIETHSEHFLRRLQRRIAEDAIKEDEVAAYFADAQKTPAKLNRLEVDSYGNIHNWPENFFGDEMTDITEQAKAAMKKKMGAKKDSTK